MRHLLGLLLIGILGAACDRASGVLVLDARLARNADGRVSAEVEVEAAEQGGRNAGAYCVSIHWFSIGWSGIGIGDSITYPPERPGIPGEIDRVEVCESDLRDGDQRTLVLVSNVGKFIPVRAPARVQVRQGFDYQRKEGLFAP